MGTGGAWVAQSVKHLPLAQVMIPGSWDGVLAHWGAGFSLCLPLPMLVLSVSLSDK